MEVDGSRRNPGPLTTRERRRCADDNLCAYCGQSGHLIGTCALVARVRQVRGAFPGFNPSSRLFHPPSRFLVPLIPGSLPGSLGGYPPSPHLVWHPSARGAKKRSSQPAGAWLGGTIPPPPFPFPLTLSSLSTNPPSGPGPATYPHSRSR